MGYAPGHLRHMRYTVRNPFKAVYLRWLRYRGFVTVKAQVLDDVGMLYVADSWFGKHGVSVKMSYARYYKGYYTEDGIFLNAIFGIDYMYVLTEVDANIALVSSNMFKRVEVSVGDV